MPDTRAKAGGSPHTRARPHRPGLALALLLAIVASVAHAEDHKFAIPAGPLGPAIIRFGEQSGQTIGLNDPRAAIQWSKGVHGQLSVDAALGRLLAGTGYVAQRVDAHSLRIVPAPAATPPVPAAAPAPAPPPAEIVVSASKQRIGLDRFPGTVTIMPWSDARAASEAAAGTQAVVDRMPMLASTGLGAGRDKLFIRGVADSSFNGPSQSTVGQYLGDVRLNFNAPDPNLLLYDINRVEVLEGPQGTLYGTGSLGGIVRMVPNTPDPGAIAGWADAAFVATQHGATGSELAGMINLPLVSDKLAVRGVGYHVIAPGYIDDLARNLVDVNRTATTGGRLDVRLLPADGWTIDFGGVIQNIQARDGQYANRDLPPLTRRSAIAQPFDNDYTLGWLTVAKAWDSMTLTSTTSTVRHNLTSVYDATGFAGTTGPVGLTEDVAITLFANETRLAGHAGRNSWFIGLSLLQSNDRTERNVADAALAPLIAGARNTTSEAALFGQYGFQLTDSLTATLGARLNYAQGGGETLDGQGTTTPADPLPANVKLLPMAALSWQPRAGLIAFAQVQQGYRAGGLTVATIETELLTQRFEPDQITTVEAGIRFGGTTPHAVHGSASVSFARWLNIQSDLIDIAGLPFTANIGDGRILAAETQLSWSPVDGLTLDAAGFLNQSILDKPAPLYAAAVDRELPNIAELGARAAFTYTVALAPTLPLTIDGALRYVGSSALGIGTLLDIRQGDYAEASLGARLGLGAFDVSLGVTNIADVHGNRFSYGNPFGVITGNQITPLRPRTLRLGITAQF